MSDFSHIGPAGQARMVDVGDKPETARAALAGARVRTTPEVIAKIEAVALAKGDVLATARIAGVMAAKRTSDLIPLCHPLSVDSIAVDFELTGDAVEIRVSVRSHGKTGVEMEALTGASVAALTIYDMCKAVDRGMIIDQVMLLEKSGGKSGRYERGLS